MHMRSPHSKYLSKLEKISETSSPSKQSQSQFQSSQELSIKEQRRRINPSSLTTSYLRFKKLEEKRPIDGGKGKNMIKEGIGNGNGGDLVMENFIKSNNGGGGSSEIIVGGMGESGNVNVNNGSALSKSVVVGQGGEEQKIHSSSNNNQQSLKFGKTMTIAEKNTRIDDLQEQIMKKKVELNSLNSCFQRRLQKKSTKFDRYFYDALCSAREFSLASGLKNKRDYLRMIIQYSQLRNQNDAKEGSVMKKGTKENIAAETNISGSGGLSSSKKALKFVLEWLLQLIKMVFRVVIAKLKVKK